MANGDKHRFAQVSAGHSHVTAPVSGGRKLLFIGTASALIVAAAPRYVTVTVGWRSSEPAASGPTREDAKNENP